VVEVKLVNEHNLDCGAADCGQHRHHESLPTAVEYRPQCERTAGEQRVQWGQQAAQLVRVAKGTLQGEPIKIEK
jgi:hypothetical protein